MQPDGPIGTFVLLGVLAVVGWGLGLGAAHACQGLRLAVAGAAQRAWLGHAATGAVVLICTLAAYVVVLTTAGTVG